jgi:hypothetical protein
LRLLAGGMSIIGLPVSNNAENLSFISQALSFIDQFLSNNGQPTIFDSV